MKTTLLCFALLGILVLQGCDSTCECDNDLINRPPVLTEIVSDPPDPIFYSDRVTFTAIATDPDGDDLQFVWDATGGDFYPEETTSNPTRWDTPVSGTFTITCTVSDGKESVNKSLDYFAQYVPAPTSTTGVIQGSVSLEDAAPGELSNSRIALFADYEDWSSGRVLAESHSDWNGNFVFGSVVPGSYYADAWLDRNDNNVLDSNDLYGVVGVNSYPDFQPNPFPVAAGQRTPMYIELIEIP